MFSLLNALLGQHPATPQLIQGDPSSVFGATPISGVPTPAPEQAPDQGIEVSHNADPKSQYRRGLIQHGTFSLGHTGGNILGLLGDALLVQGGKDKQYDPRLQDARSAEALRSFTDDPAQAVRMLNEVDPDAAAQLWQKHQQIQNDKTRADADAADAGNKLEDLTHQRALAFIGSATDRTLPMVKGIVKDLYARSGVQPLFDIDSINNLDDLKALAMGGVKPDNQARLAEQESYHDEMEAQRKEALKHQDDRYYTGLQHEDARTYSGQGIARQNAAETHRHNVEMEKKGAKKAPPKVMFDANGEPYISH